MSYENECAAGRAQAAALIQECAATDNLPKLVAAIRAMAARDDGEAVGFMYALAMGLASVSADDQRRKISA